MAVFVEGLQFVMRLQELQEILNPSLPMDLSFVDPLLSHLLQGTLCEGPKSNQTLSSFMAVSAGGLMHIQYSIYAFTVLLHSRLYLHTGLGDIISQTFISVFLLLSDLSVYLHFALTYCITLSTIKYTQLYAFSWLFHAQFLFDEQTHFLMKKPSMFFSPSG